MSHVFEVWAPRAEAVEVEVGGRRVAMESCAGGWWRAEVENAAPGSDYRYVLDGGDPLPDPRSPYQPQGVNGPSRLVDHHAFPWTDDGWAGIHLASAVIYELHVGTFSPEATFDGAIVLLDHLVDLGVTAVELLPVAQFSGPRGWGYDGVDLYATHHDYGGPDGLKRLVDSCHARGLGVILDVVYNHLGPEGNHLGRFGPYFTDVYATPWGQAVNFDQRDSDEVRRFVVDNALMWMRDYRIDGLRLDAIHAIVDTSAIHILEQLSAEVADLAAATGRPKVLIAESDLNDPRVISPAEVGGYGIDAQWSDDLHHALHTVLTGDRAGYYEDFGSMGQLATALERGWVFAGVHSRHRGRVHGRPHNITEGWRLLGYLQNHDQVGNRARGDRIGHGVPADRLMVGAALYLTSPFTPMIFQGEEWAASTPFQYFTSHEDRELGRAVRQGRRAEFASFGWDPEEVPDPQDPATFEVSRLEWEEVGSEPHSRMLQWYRDLIALRRDTPALRVGRLDKVQVRSDEDARWLVVERGPVTIAANLGAEAVEVPLAEERPARLLLSSTSAKVGDGSVSLPPDSVVILGE